MHVTQRYTLRMVRRTVVTISAVLSLKLCGPFLYRACLKPAKRKVYARSNTLRAVSPVHKSFTFLFWRMRTSVSSNSALLPDKTASGILHTTTKIHGCWLCSGQLSWLHSNAFLQKRLQISLLCSGLQ